MARLSSVEGAALVERFRHYLRDHRQPVTRQRDLVAELVLTSEEHLSADQVRRRLGERGEKVGLATIYRTLELLEKSGLARGHDFGQGFRRFEPMSAQTDHEHLICVRCGRVVEFNHERLERMLPIIADEHGFQPERHRVEIYGVCQPCQRKGLG
ncbi:MAG: Fur family transcriptional regulator [Gemmatimonadales bacterium]